MTTNKELVRQLAEEMAKTMSSVIGSALDDNKSDWSSLASGYIKLTEEIATKNVIPFAGKMFEEGFNLGSEYRENNPLTLLQDQCECEMQKRGLIAEKEVEGEE